MRYVMLLILILALAGCGGDDYNGGEPGDYEAYWDVTEALSKGHIPTEMTQRPEAPAPPSDQKDCPSIMALLLLIVAYYVIGGDVWRMKNIRWSGAASTSQKMRRAVWS